MCSPPPDVICPALEVSLFWEPDFCLLSSPGKVAWGKGRGWKPFGPGEQGQPPVKIIGGGEMPEEAPPCVETEPFIATDEPPSLRCLL